MASPKGRTEKSHNVAFAKGGNTSMAPAQAADAATSGVTRDQSMSDTGAHPGLTDAGGHTAKGGSTKMFGYTGSQPAQAGITGAR